jgi:hypothetical protein
MMDLRRLCLATLLPSLCACSNGNNADGRLMPNQKNEMMAATESKIAVRVFSYVEAKHDLAHPERIPTQVAITGNLAVANGCLVLESGNRQYNLLFATGSAGFNQERNTLSVEGQTYALGSKVSLGGSGMGVVESLPDGDPKQICAIDTNWVVIPGSMKTAV